MAAVEVEQEGDVGAVVDELPVHVQHQMPERGRLVDVGGLAQPDRVHLLGVQLRDGLLPGI